VKPRRQFADLEFHLDLRRSLRVGRSKHTRWRVSLELRATYAAGQVARWHVAFVPEPFQAPAAAAAA
jgi:hypothetical protein